MHVWSGPLFVAVHSLFHLGPTKTIRRYGNYSKFVREDIVVTKKSKYLQCSRELFIALSVAIVNKTQ